MHRLDIFNSLYFLISESLRSYMWHFTYKSSNFIGRVRAENFLNGSTDMSGVFVSLSDRSDRRTKERTHRRRREFFLLRLEIAIRCGASPLETVKSALIRHGHSWTMQISPPTIIFYETFNIYNAFGQCCINSDRFSGGLRSSYVGK